MECCKFLLVAIVSVVLLFPVIDAWGNDGHYIVCNVAQSRLSKAAAGIVEELLPKFAENDLGSVCKWADQVKFHYPWSRSLHYVNTPDVCNYNFANNLTEALMFFSHFMGDVHQPLHAGFASDKGGNTIEVHWFTRKQNLHHIWDNNIIETAQERFYSSNLVDQIDAIQQNITTDWADQVKTWENCSYTDTTCANVYASESIEAACEWAYKDVSEGSTLEDDYFLSRLPIVNKRLAQAGVRLAAILNHYFDK